MDDLKKKIAEIEAEVKTNYRFNRYEAIVQLAIDRNELNKLFSADPSYIYNNDGKKWLAMNSYFGETLEPFNIVSVFAAYMSIYLRIKIKDRKEKTFCSEKLKMMFLEAFKDMVSGTPEQLYWAVKIFQHLSISIADRSSAFYRVAQSEQLDDELRPYLVMGIATSDIDLKTVHIYDCQNISDGLWGYCKFYSDKLKDKGIKGFIIE
jgi:hypothetical protein